MNQNGCEPTIIRQDVVIMKNTRNWCSQSFLHTNLQKQETCQTKAKVNPQGTKMLRSNRPVETQHVSISSWSPLLGETFEKSCVFILGFSAKKQSAGLRLQSQQDCVFGALRARQRRHCASSDILRRSSEWKGSKLRPAESDKVAAFLFGERETSTDWDSLCPAVLACSGSVPASRYGCKDSLSPNVTLISFSFPSIPILYVNICDATKGHRILADTSPGLSDNNPSQLWSRLVCAPFHTTLTIQLLRWSPEWQINSKKWV